jgi:hypothetical protein
MYSYVLFHLYRVEIFFRLIICIPVLKGSLREPYIGHLAKLVEGVTLLISDKVSSGDIEKSEKALVQFYKEAAGLYSDAVLTYNMHLLTHAPECVRKWGPLWAYSLFQFEHANGIIGGMFKGTRCVAMQIVKNLAVVEGIRCVNCRIGIEYYYLHM